MSGTGARENHSTMTTVKGLGGFLFSSIPFFLSLPPEECAVHIQMCVYMHAFVKVRTKTASVNNQPFNGQLLTHLTQTHTHRFQSAEEKHSEPTSQSARFTSATKESMISGRFVNQSAPVLVPVSLIFIPLPPPPILLLFTSLFPRVDISAVKGG